MNTNLLDFVKTKDFLVCVDSDGCAMDTMDVKHEKCFGPVAVEVWGLQELETRFLEVWNQVNLYSLTRGINRFKGLVLTFERVAEEGFSIPSLATVKEWTESTNELSNPSLERELLKTGDKQLSKALEWSNKVNQAIAQLSGVDQPFHHVKEGLAFINESADLAIVSSANGRAVEEEWTRHELAPYVQVMLGQEAGTKASCIHDLKQCGYSNEHVLMVGDAPGDLEAAQSNGVFYYPILVGKEAFSWKRLAEEALFKLKDGTYKGAYQQQLIDEFFSILKN